MPGDCPCPLANHLGAAKSSRYVVCVGSLQLQLLLRGFFFDKRVK